MSYRNYAESNGWMVSANGDGDFTTIASALTAATTASYSGSIFIHPGTYTENLTMVPNVNLVAYVADSYNGSVTIVGKITHSASGTSNISGIQLKTNSDYCISVTGALSSLVLINCALNCLNNTGVQQTNGALSLNYCVGFLATTGIGYFAVSGGTLNVYFCTFANAGNSLTASTVSAGQLNMFYTSMNAAINLSSTGVMVGSNIFFNTTSLNISCLVQNATAAGTTLSFCNLTGGTAVCASVGSGATLTLIACNFNTANASAITGAGTLNYNTCFSQQQYATGVTTQSGSYTLCGSVALNGILIMTGAGSPSGSITAPKGSLYLNTTGSSTSTRAYINTNSGTTWTNLISAG